jgi:MFS superfamily sulfate permease-like transporter
MAFVSGSELSVSGPAAGLTVIVASAITSLGGFEVFTIAVLLSGLIQLGLGVARAGVIGDYIPNSVIKGMLAAIGIVIILKQIPYSLGFDADYIGDETFQQDGQSNTFTDLVGAVMAPAPAPSLISAVALALMVAWERPLFKRMGWTAVLPAPLVCVIVGTLLNEFFAAAAPGWQLTAERQQLVQLPELSSARRFPGHVHRAGVVGRAAGRRVDRGGDHRDRRLDRDPAVHRGHRQAGPRDAHLRSQSRVARPGHRQHPCGLLGGLPITSVIVRSSANIYAGARTRLSTLVHGLGPAARRASSSAGC